ncbi:MAG TPA: hypothetical protein ENN44_05785 [Methanoculleus sp.]|nr:hypothetical protein [Methanoculleus sp.]
MVMNDEGQLYTIEGITAGIIMLVTAYAVFSSGFVFTPGDAHIADMQLQQLGYDALLVMDTPLHAGDESRLQELIASSDVTPFTTEFNSYLSKGTGATYMINPLTFTVDTRTQWNATIYYRDMDDSDKIRSYSFGHSTLGDDFVTREPAISVTRYVYLDDKPINLNHISTEAYQKMDDPQEGQMVLFEVLLWRG